jgi:hypothetical protein
MVASGANLSTIDETEFNQAAFRFTTFRRSKPGQRHGSARAHFRRDWIFDADLDL